MVRRTRNQPASQEQNTDQQDGDARPVTRNITGPQSALTDFLASHNISATRIRQDADQRRQRAASSRQNNEVEVDDGDPGPSSARQGGGKNKGKKLTKKQIEAQKAIEKIKSSKGFKKRKRDAGDSDDEDEIARAIFEEHHAPLPGQMENCEICSKRFTVTPYSVAGPEGGLLCTACGRKVAKEREGQAAKKKAPRKQVAGVGSRRAALSRMLDGDIGTKSLATLCVQTLAKNVEMADDLGDLPEHLVDKIARIFSKRRLLRSETLPLFVRPSTEILHIYDGANLRQQDLISIFQICPKLKDLKIRCGIQFKDEVMDYLLSRNISMEYFYLHGANLLSQEKWHEFLQAKGSTLKGLQVYYTDKHFGDETIGVLKQCCPNIRRLKIENNQMVSDDGIKAMGYLPLQHVGFQVQHSISSRALVHLVTNGGASLQTLSMKIVPKADDRVLQAIHKHCASLVKLRITDSECMSDDGFVDLFTDWKNPGLDFLDLEKCRHLDSTKPRDNVDRVGLCGDGFKALMKHSGHSLRVLNLHACRHISQEAFEEVFSQDAVYSNLKKLEISFCEEVTDFIVGSIFRSCPNIREVNVFGCMKVKDIRVPRGVILVGVPNAQGMVIEGTD